MNGKDIDGMCIFMDHINGICMEHLWQNSQMEQTNLKTRMIYDDIFHHSLIIHLRCERQGKTWQRRTTMHSQ